MTDIYQCHDGLGALCTSLLSDKIGRRLTYGVALLLSLIGISCEMAAVTNQVFFAGKIVGGFSCGILLQNSLPYIGEIAPMPLRGVLTVASFIFLHHSLPITAYKTNYDSTLIANRVAANHFKTIVTTTEVKGREAKEPSQ